MNRRQWLLGASHALPMFSILPARAAEEQIAGRLPVSRSILSNGLTLLCRENRSTELVSLVCLVQAGQPDEPERLAGIAAVTAEAMLRGTTTRRGRSFDEAIMLAGGNISAVPGPDYTEFKLVSTGRQWASGLKLMGDVLANPRLSDEDVAAARAAVLARLNRLQSDWTAASYLGLTRTLYPTAPYGRPVDGFQSTIEKITSADVRQFWGSNYVQNRMWAAIVGDVESRSALSQAQKQFVSIPFNRNAVSAAAPPEPARPPQYEIIERAPPGALLAQVMVGLMAPPTTRQTYPVHLLLDTLIGGGKRSRLWLRVRETENTGYELGSLYQPLRHQSHLVAYLMTPYFRRDPQSGGVETINLDPIVKAIVDQFRGLAAEPPSAVELARARAFALGRYARTYERTADQARSIAWNEAIGLGAGYDGQLGDALAGVTPQQIQEAAARLVGHYALLVTLPAPPQ